MVASKPPPTHKPKNPLTKPLRAKGNKAGNGRAGSARRGKDNIASGPDESLRVRGPQNGVGKRYRDKLSAVFESLQATLGVDGEGRFNGRTSNGSNDGKDEEGGANGDGNGEELGDGEGDSSDEEEEQAEKGKGQSVRNGRRKQVLNKAKIIDLTSDRIGVLWKQREELRIGLEALAREKEASEW
ncbi:hypothetical protein B0J18DRAFT_469952 [Chaetomium sp. MPI-SDFR-AT-0129]|nr:hypothetical protein B0J18DRAFT_469952 [Chaetomium sp. MPI-SDFR-AT-0129]